MRIEAGLNGVLYVVSLFKGKKTVELETTQPFLALEKYYEIDVGKPLSLYNDLARK